MDEKNHNEPGDVIEKLYGHRRGYASNTLSMEPERHGEVTIQWKLYSDDVLRINTYADEPGMVSLSFESLTGEHRKSGYKIHFPLDKENTRSLVAVLNKAINYIPSPLPRVMPALVLLKYWWKSIWFTADILCEAGEVTASTPVGLLGILGSKLVVYRVRSKENRNIEWIGLDFLFNPRPMATLEIQDAEKLVNILGNVVKL